ncbi:MAG: WGR domain-containing protein [Sulfuricurvum sp.]|nr:WGR domain-containing protein [Sulfuricurvum sp.]
MKILLNRTVNKRERYYCLELVANLFGEFLLIRTYGGCRRAKPTRIISQSFETYVNAYRVWESLLENKYKRGYTLLEEKYD